MHYHLVRVPFALAVSAILLIPALSTRAAEICENDGADACQSPTGTLTTNNEDLDTGTGDVSTTDVNASGDVTATGDLNGTNLNASGDVNGTNLNAAGDLGVTGNANVSGNADVSGNLGVGGKAGFSWQW